jgi:dynein heavy chain
VVRPYAQKAKWKDPEQPVKWLTDMFNKCGPAGARAAWLHCCLHLRSRPTARISPGPPAPAAPLPACRYVPGTIFEMRKSFSHITPLGTMNWVTTLVNILEGCLRPENLSNKADQGLFEMYFVFAIIWAFGGALVEKDGINYRR